LNLNYFVCSSKTLKVHYKTNNKIIGDRFLLKLTFKADKLNKDGFVVDFTVVNSLLNEFRDDFEKKPLNNFITDKFSFKKLLNYILLQIKTKLKQETYYLTQISLEGENEAFVLKID